MVRWRSRSLRSACRRPSRQYPFGPPRAPRFPPAPRGGGSQDSLDRGLVFLILGKVHTFVLWTQNSAHLYCGEGGVNSSCSEFKGRMIAHCKFFSQISLFLSQINYLEPMSSSHVDLTGDDNNTDTVVDLTGADSSSSNKDLQLTKYCFTWNAPDKNNSRAYLDAAWDEMVEACEAAKSPFEYVVAGFELGGKNQRWHLQGWCKLRRKQRLTTLANLVGGKRIHWKEPDTDHDEKAWKYCVKDGDYKEWGVRPAFVAANPGHRRNDQYREIVDLARQKKYKQIAADHPDEFLRHLKSIVATSHLLNNDLMEDLKELDPATFRVNYWEENARVEGKDPLNPPRKISDIEIDGGFYWIFGGSGSGKSRGAREQINLMRNASLVKYDKVWRCYWKMYSEKWWEGYEGEEIVLIDDIAPDAWKQLTLWKVWLDAYPFRAEVKGSSVCLRPKVVIFTSNYHPDQCFACCGESDLVALRNRLKLIYVRSEHDPRYVRHESRLGCTRDAPITQPGTVITFNRISVPETSSLFTPLKLDRSETVCPGAPKREDRDGVAALLNFKASQKHDEEEEEDEDEELPLSPEN